MKQLKFFLLREKIIGLIREFFIRKRFHEVITPVLNNTIPLEPNIYPFQTEWTTVDGIKKMYLSTSPEKNLKEMLAMGLGNCFSVGHSFRNLESAGSLHTPEFLMLEWYRKNASYGDIMNDVRKLILYIQKKMKIIPMYDQSNDWAHYPLTGLFKKYTSLHLEEIVLSDEKLFAYAKKKGYQTKNTSWDNLYDQIFVSEIEPKLPKNPCFLVDFPSRISPLCTPKKDAPHFAERFELYILGVELANGNTENTDIQLVKKGLRHPIDDEFLASLKKMGNASYAGIGLGVDRLSMLFSGSRSLNYIKFD